MKTIFKNIKNVLLDEILTINNFKIIEIMY